MIAMLVGFTAGYRGGAVDEVLNMFTNIVLVIPTLAVLLIIAAYISVQGVAVRGVVHRLHILAVGRAGHSRSDVLAHVERVRRHGADQWSK